MTERKARPILFSGEMVRALLAGQKTQTRRIVKPLAGAGWLPETANGDALRLGMITSPHPKKGKFGLFMRREIHPGSGKYEHDLVPCPYGKPGDLLWCRETFSGPHCMEATNELPAHPPSRWPPDCPVHYWADGNPFYGDWTRPRPSIHMPRHLSRLTLEITDVRVERLHEISEEDADAECFGGNFPGEVLPELFPGDPEQWSHLSITECFASLWESINGVGSWATNPWVWVIQFRAHKMNVDRFLEVPRD